MEKKIPKRLSLTLGDCVAAELNVDQENLNRDDANGQKWNSNSEEDDRRTAGLSAADVVYFGNAGASLRDASAM